jgi:hypothetical protein
MNYSRFFITTAAVAGLLYLFGVSFSWMKFYNLIISMAVLIVIFAVLVLRKNISSNPWQGLLFTLIALSIGMSIFTSVLVTHTEAANRASVKAAAQAFEVAVPDGAVVFIFGGEYVTYTIKDYIFLDYRYGPEDIPHVVGYYKNRPIYVLFKDESDKEKFSEFELVPAGPIRTYKISSEK